MKNPFILYFFKQQMSSTTEPVVTTSSLRKTKDINGNNSVASSLNSLVKKQFINMTDQYTIYASAITEMEEKIKALKNIMLSDIFIKNCHNVSSSLSSSSSPENGVKANISNMVVKPGRKTTNTNTNTNTVGNGVESKSNEDYFTPKQSDSLFWCFYILCNSYSSYEYETNYFTAEQQFKIQTVERVKKGENKNILKEHKISKNYFESGLMKTINPKILQALCIFYKINVFYVHKNTYYEIMAGDQTVMGNETPVHIIRYNAETNNYSVGVSNSTERLELYREYMEKIKASYWKLDNLEKPIRAITSYSMGDLTTICTKLDIPIIGESNKKRTKADLYASILQKI